MIFVDEKYRQQGCLLKYIYICKSYQIILTHAKIEAKR